MIESRYSLENEIAEVLDFLNIIWLFYYTIIPGNKAGKDNNSLLYLIDPINKSILTQKTVLKMTV